MIEFKILRIGNRYTNNDWERNNLLITNFAFSIGCLSSSILSIHLLLIGNLASASIISAGFFICILGFTLNYFGKFSFALIAACCITGIIIPIHNWYFPNTGIVTFLLTACVIVAFLSGQKPILRLFLMVFTYGALIFCIMTIMFKHQGVQVNGENKTYLILNLVAALTSLVVAVGYFSSFLQKQQLRFENLNEIKNKLLAVLAHDIRGPLNNLVKISELIDEDDIDKRNSEKFMKLLTKEVKNTVNLLDDVLIWIKSQIEGLQANKVLFDLKSLCEKVIDENIVKAEMKGVKIELKGNAIKTFADKEMIALALRNLLSNAIKFSPKETGLIIFEIKNQNGAPEISITDNGEGLADFEIEKIKKLISFTNSGTNSEKGFGIGLFLTNEFLRQNNAVLDMKNAQNGGAQFSIKFSN